MGLSREDRAQIVKYRVEKAYMTFQQADGNVKLEYWNTVANRLYYAAYYAASALLISNGITAQSHSGVLQMFGLHFIKTGIVPKQVGKLLSVLFNLRQTGDYEDNFDLTSEDILPLVEPAKNFIDIVVGLI